MRGPRVGGTPLVLARGRSRQRGSARCRFSVGRQPPGCALRGEGKRLAGGSRDMRERSRGRRVAGAFRRTTLRHPSTGTPHTPTRPPHAFSHAPHSPARPVLSNPTGAARPRRLQETEDSPELTWNGARSSGCGEGRCCCCLAAGQTGLREVLATSRVHCPNQKY